MKIRTKTIGNAVEVKILITHEMETGLRKGSDGNLIPAWFIQKLTVRCNEKTVLTASWGASVSKNPFLSFFFEGAKTGDILEVTWTDNKGESKSEKAQVL